MTVAQLAVLVWVHYASFGLHQAPMTPQRFPVWRCGWPASCMPQLEKQSLSQRTSQEIKLLNGDISPPQRAGRVATKLDILGGAPTALAKLSRVPPAHLDPVLLQAGAMYSAAPGFSPGGVFLIA